MLEARGVDSFREALAIVARDMKAKYNLNVDLEISDNLGTVSAQLGRVLLRSIRELLFNVVKHAEAVHATVKIHRDDGSLTVVVSDNGRGFDPGDLEDAVADSGLGLVGLKNRIELLDGEVNIESATGKGCVVTIRLPDLPPDRNPDSD